MRRKKRKNKVVVAMSGGIDSSVAAALLKKKGFEVIGVFMKFWSDYKKNGSLKNVNKCCLPEAEKRARKVAKILKIPFYVFDFEKEFKKRIVDVFLKEYKAGETPNPCVFCNKEIKFGILLKKALSLGADYVATGHYAIVKTKGDKIFLFKGKDKNKDQSYFLWQLNQKQLKHILFPLGSYTKNKVRELAKKFKLPLMDISESQEICFIQTNVSDFLRKHLKEKPGKIINKNGDILGEHKGLWFYTIGQRKGIKLPAGPYYVLKKDFKNNYLVVTKNEKDLLKNELICRNVNWILGKEPKLPITIEAKIRYRNISVMAMVLRRFKNKMYVVKFKKYQRAITPGQSVVFYKNNQLLGGGIIAKTN